MVIVIMKKSIDKKALNNKSLTVGDNSESLVINTLTEALKHFEKAEANLVKLEKLWKEMLKNIPDEITFILKPEYEEKSELYKIILPHLPKIDGWSPTTEPMELNDIAQSRLLILRKQSINQGKNLENTVYYLTENVENLLVTH